MEKSLAEFGATLALGGLFILTLAAFLYFVIPRVKKHADAIKYAATPLLLSFSIFLFSSCTIKDAYLLAVTDAAVIDAGEVKPVKPILGETATVVTWTMYPASYPEGDETTLKWGVTWVSLDGAVKERCKLFSEDTLYSDLQMLLGLPAETGTRSFVTMRVDADDIFRPCIDPDIKTTECSANTKKQISPDHLDWYAKQVAGSYEMPGGYPWTRLGYTYNWKRGASEVGVSEYVVKKGAEVEVISVTDTKSYCD